ncbi:MAG: elongation factor P [Phycisphaeraceae bacterium]
MKANDVRTGNALEMDGQLWLVVKLDHVKPGKGPAYTQVKLKNLQTGNHIEKRLRGSDEVTEAVLDRREMEYLYDDASGSVFMDNETYEQFTVPKDILGDTILYLKPNTPVTALVYQGNVMSINPPAAVELEVKDTPPGIKGATATNQPKEAILETGLKTRVPAFVNNGDTVKISTDSGEYLGRQ